MITWADSSKAMECDDIVHLCGEATKRNYSISRLVTDYDTYLCAQLKHKKQGTKG